MTYGIPEARAIRTFRARGRAILNKIVARNNKPPHADMENMIANEFEYRGRLQEICSQAPQTRSWEVDDSDQGIGEGCNE